MNYLHMEQGTKRSVLKVQVQAGRPHSGRPTLLLCSCPISTERKHQHLQSYAVDLHRGTFATVGGRPA